MHALKYLKNVNITVNNLVLLQPTTPFRSSKDIDERTIKKIIEKRNDAKKAKNFELADDLRDQLLEEGVILEDSRDGTKWRRI